MGGLSAAHALLRAGADVTVLERASANMPAGAGVGLDVRSAAILKSWGMGDAFAAITCPQAIDVIRYIDPVTKAATELARNEQHNHLAIHWHDLQR